jgi:hypothetical protein
MKRMYPRTTYPEFFGRILFMHNTVKPELTSRQAYLAMFEFLHRYYERCHSDEIGGLLGGLALLEDGQPADRAYASDWAAAVRVVLATETPAAGNREADFRLS